MNKHAATIFWQNTGPDFLGRLYSREHTIRFDGGIVIQGSASPHVVAAPWSNADAVDPEEAYVAAVASCHMLWFLHQAVDAGFEVLSYEDCAVGEMCRNEHGKFWLSRIILSPAIFWKEETQIHPEQVELLHKQAHENCFIANSIKTEVVIRAVSARTYE